jgi:hypothetical protein
MGSAGDEEDRKPAVEPTGCWIGCDVLEWEGDPRRRLEWRRRAMKL